MARSCSLVLTRSTRSPGGSISCRSADASNSPHYGVVAIRPVRVRCCFHSHSSRFLSEKYQPSNSRNCSRGAGKQRFDGFRRLAAPGRNLGDGKLFDILVEQHLTSFGRQRQQCRPYHGGLLQVLDRRGGQDGAVAEIGGDVCAVGFGRVGMSQLPPPVQRDSASRNRKKPATRLSPAGSNCAMWRMASNQVS